MLSLEFRENIAGGSRVAGLRLSETFANRNEVIQFSETLDHCLIRLGILDDDLGVAVYGQNEGAA